MSELCNFLSDGEACLIHYLIITKTTNQSKTIVYVLANHLKSNKCRFHRIMDSQFAFGLLSFEVVVHEVPVYQLHQRLQVLVSGVSVVDVVGVLPDIDCE